MFAASWDGLRETFCLDPISSKAALLHWKRERLRAALQRWEGEGVDVAPAACKAEISARVHLGASGWIGHVLLRWLSQLSPPAALGSAPRSSASPGSAPSGSRSPDVLLGQRGSAPATPSRGTDRASVLSADSSYFRFAALAPCSLLMWPQPKYSVAGVREACGGGKPSRPFLRRDSTDASDTGHCETDVDQKWFKPLPLLEHSHCACLVF